MTDDTEMFGWVAHRNQVRNKNVVTKSHITTHLKVIDILEWFPKMLVSSQCLLVKCKTNILIH